MKDTSKMNYGEIIDSNFHPERENIYKEFATYFNFPIMTKIKDVENYSVYMCNIKCMLSNEKRYIIVFVLKDNSNTGTTEKLENLIWESIQTRTIDENYKLTPHTYIPKRYPPLMIKIYLKQQNKESYIYSSEDGVFNIVLLPKKNKLEYHPSGNLVTAIETYNTIISFN